MTKRKKVNYVNNKEFLQALIDYKAVVEEARLNGKDEPPIPQYIGVCIYEIAERLSTKPNFYGYSYRDEMVGDGLENALQVIGNFDPEKSSNPFAYFTQIIWYAFLRRIEKEKKQLYIRHKVTENAMVYDSLIERDGGTDGEASYVDLDNDYMSDFVDTYEKRLNKKKQERDRKRGVEAFIPDDEDNNNDTSDN